jgi:hypothetical protein
MHMPDLQVPPLLQGWPSEPGSGCKPLQTGMPALQETDPIWHSTLHELPSLHVTHAPFSHTFPVPQLVPSAAELAAPVS